MSTHRSNPGGGTVRDPGGATRGPNGRRWCVTCARYRGRYVEVPPRRQVYCSPACADEYGIRNFPSTARAHVFRRDRGVCARCGLDTEAFRAAALRWKRAAEGYPSELDASLAPLWRHFAGYRQFTSALGRLGFHRSVFHSWYDVDHIVPVVEGGGECDLDNLRTVCLPCHAALTRELRARLAAKRRPVQMRQAWLPLVEFGALAAPPEE